MLQLLRQLSSGLFNNTSDDSENNHLLPSVTLEVIQYNKSTRTSPCYKDVQRDIHVTGLWKERHLCRREHDNAMSSKVLK